MRKRTWTIIFSMLFICNLVACGTTETSEPSSPEEQVEEKKVLRVGTSGIYPPFGYLGEEGEMVGYEVDIFEAIGEELGFEVEWTIAEFAGLFGMLDSGRIDTRVEIPRSEFTFDHAVQKIIELNEIYDPKFIYVDAGNGEYQIEKIIKITV